MRLQHLCDLDGKVLYTICEVDDVGLDLRRVDLYDGLDDVGRAMARLLPLH